MTTAAAAAVESLDAASFKGVRHIENLITRYGKSLQIGVEESL